MAIDIVQWILLALDFLSTHNIESGPKSMNRKGEKFFVALRSSLRVNENQVSESWHSSGLSIYFIC